MTAPPDQRGDLFVLYAFNLEIARAAWVSQEPIIAEMRLQFWRDVLDDIGNEKPARAHEVAAPLAELVKRRQLPLARLHEMIDARRWDIERQPFDDEVAFTDHIQKTSGNLMCLSVRCLGPEEDDLATQAGCAIGIANWLVAIPAMETANRIPLVDGRADAIRNLASHALAKIKAVKASRAPKHALPALRAGWLARSILKTVTAEPGRVGEGTLRPNEFHRRLSLLYKTLAGQW